MELKIDRSFTSAIELEKKIADIETTIKYTRKSSRIRKHKRKLNHLKDRLDYIIYRHNQQHLLEYLEHQVGLQMDSWIVGLDLVDYKDFPWKG